MQRIPQQSKVFWFFFSKENCFLRPHHHPPAIRSPATLASNPVIHDIPLGRSAADGRPANPVRSGRKQPQWVTARVDGRPPTSPRSGVKP